MSAVRSVFRHHNVGRAALIADETHEGGGRGAGEVIASPLQGIDVGLAYLVGRFACRCHANSFTAGAAIRRGILSALTKICAVDGLPQK